jgi:hypothetical protein
VSGILPEKEL